jgi:hypothetical protein
MLERAALDPSTHIDGEGRMSERAAAPVVAVLLAVAIGCAAQSKMLVQRQEGAVETALARGRFELNCPSATATVLSRDFIQPSIRGPWVSGLERVEYTVGVEGCNQRTSYVVLCQVGTDTCFAAQPRETFQGGQKR